MLSYTWIVWSAASTESAGATTSRHPGRPYAHNADKGKPMTIVQSLFALALRPLFEVACKSVGLDPQIAGKIEGFIRNHLTDHSQRLPNALRKANDRAWQALEITFAGDSFGDWVRVTFASAEYRAFREQVKAFLAANPLIAFETKTAFRRACLEQLQAARKAGFLTNGQLSPQELTHKAAALSSFSDPAKRLAADYEECKG